MLRLAGSWLAIAKKWSSNCAVHAVINAFALKHYKSINFEFGRSGIFRLSALSRERAESVCYRAKPSSFVVGKLVFAVAIMGFLLGNLPQSQAASITKDRRYAAIVIDMHTGKVHYSRRADSRRYPASLTKMMTLYMLFDALDRGKVKKSTQIRFSKHAAGQPPSKLGLRPGQSISVENAILALVTKSANDVAAAVAEHLGGTERRFADAMTKRARALGMRHTRFMNASGLPDRRQTTTARDMGKLVHALWRNHRRYYHYFSTKKFHYQGRRYKNHNRLLGRVRGVDGVKTGYTRASGFNLASSVHHRNKYVIAVVMGGPTARARDRHMQWLLDRYVPRAIAKRIAPRRRKLNIDFAAMPVPAHRPGAAMARQTAMIDENARASVPIISSQVDLPPRPAAGTTSTPVNADVASADVAAPVTGNQDKSGATQHGAAQHGAAHHGATVNTSTAPTSGGRSAAQAELASRLARAPWLIQIGAFNDENAARARLEAAMKQVGNELTPRLAYTEPVETSSKTLFRARFAGFARQEAVATCAKLKKANFSCMALKP